MKIKQLIIFSVLLLITPNLVAAANTTEAFLWLLGQSNEGNYNDDVVITSIAMMALDRADLDTYAEKSLTWLRSKEDDEHCWPEGNCRVKDTAFALLALKQLGEDTSEGEEWLTNAQTIALTGKWWLQISTENTGTCKVSYYKDDKSVEKTITVDAGTFPGCRGDTWFDIDDCMEPNLLSKKASLELDINCASLDISPILSIIYNSGNTYYLTDEAYASRAKVRINNGCFGTSSKGACNYETTLYTNWILKELQSEINTDLWLKDSDNYNVIDPMDNSVFHLTTEEVSYLDNLKAQQRNDGSWELNSYITALSILAMKQTGGSQTEIDAAITWLDTRQGNDGSWDSDLLNTAFVLYAAFSDAAVTLPKCDQEWECDTWSNCKNDEQTRTCTCDCTAGVGCLGSGLESRECETNKTCVEQDGEICSSTETCDGKWLDATDTSRCCSKKCSTPTGGYCGNGVCDPEETPNTCPDDCGQGICIVNAVCESEFGESSKNCPEDCKEDVSAREEEEAECGNNIVEGYEECDGTDDSTCPNRCTSYCECEERKGSLAWLWFLIILLLLVAGGYYLHKKGGFGDIFNLMKKKPSTPKKPDFRPFTSQLEARKPTVSYRPQPQSLRRRTPHKKTRLEQELDESIKEAKKLLGK